MASVSSRQIVRGDRNVLISSVSGSQIQINYQNESRLVPLERAVMAVRPEVTAPARLLKAPCRGYPGGACLAETSRSGAEGGWAVTQGQLTSFEQRCLQL